MLSSLLTLAAGDPAGHVYNHVHLGAKNAEGYWLWSGNQGNLVLSMLILMIGGWFVASKVKTGPESAGNDRFITKNKFAHMIEVICVYLREDVARPLLGERTNSLMPFLWTIFFFILVNNLLGLVPFLDLAHLLRPDVKEAHATLFLGGTATQNLWVTAVLAVIAGFFFNLVAIRRLGIVGYLQHLTAGAPFPANIIIFFLELFSQIVIKPFALALRLAANMTAGHILLATVCGFAGQVAVQGFIIRGPVTLVSVVGGFGVMLLEIFVAFMQAFVFTFLNIVFISLMDHHDHEHGHEHEHAHATGHEHAH